MDSSASPHRSKVPTVKLWPHSETFHFLSSSASSMRTKAFPGPHTPGPAVLHNLTLALPGSPAPSWLPLWCRSWDFLSAITYGTISPYPAWSECSPGPASPSEGRGEWWQPPMSAPISQCPLPPWNLAPAIL